MKCSTPNSGFSYIELLVCTALIMILYAVYFGAGSRSYETKAKAQCASNLARMHLALSLYAQEHDGAFPTSEGATSADGPLSLLVPQYTSDTSLFICPAGTASALPEAVSFSGRRTSYAYYMGVKNGPQSAAAPLVSDSQLNVSPKRAGEPIFAEKHVSPGGNHRQFGGNILFADGHVESVETKAPRDLFPAPGSTLLNPIP
jgi:prepilin-type processing-associated H-X9-DG protein